MRPRKRQKVKRNREPLGGDGGGGFDVLFQDDPPFSFYAMILSIDESVGATANDAQVYTVFDAAYVGWYSQIDPRNPPALNAVEGASGARLLEWISTPVQFANLDQQLQAAGQALEESSWWLITQAFYDLRGTVHLEQFRPQIFDPDPSAVGEPTARHEDFFVLPRLIVPRKLFSQWLFASRERY